MHAGHHYSLREALVWSRRWIYLFVLTATVPTVLFEVLGWRHLVIPWLPIALIGTAVAFLIGFKNNASYGRLWEARQIWGAIVNHSRAFGFLTRDFVRARDISDGELAEVHRRIIHPHLAWLTALRYQLREPRAWENMARAYNAEYRKRFFQVAELDGRLDDELARLLAPAEHEHVKSKRNRATHLLALQSRELRQLHERGLLDDFRHIELARLVEALCAEQGRCERIKNFPYPRQFATMNLYFVWIFILLLPFGMLQEFNKLGERVTWLTIPFTVLVAWIFMTMEKIGEGSENPFEGSSNDVPITALARTIEIDLREMLDEREVPEPLRPMNDILT